MRGGAAARAVIGPLTKTRTLEVQDWVGRVRGPCVEWTGDHKEPFNVHFPVLGELRIVSSHLMPL